MASSVPSCNKMFIYMFNNVLFLLNILSSQLDVTKFVRYRKFFVC
jgi:hypothetical protein